MRRLRRLYAKTFFPLFIAFLIGVGLVVFYFGLSFLFDLIDLWQ